MMSIQAFAVNTAIHAMSKKRDSGPKDYLAERKANAEKSTIKIKKYIRFEQISLAGIQAEKLTGRKSNGKTILYIHGGGFTTGSAAERRWITQSLVKWYGYSVISPDYRLSPEHKWPCHLEDCYNFYRSLLESGCNPKELIFMGESAGGTLCLSLALRLRDEGLPLPQVIAVFSPWTDQTGMLPSHTGNAALDDMVRGLFDEEQYRAEFGIKPTLEDLKAPLVSPLYGDYAGLPPVFMSVSDSEMLYDDSVLLYEKLKKAGHMADLQVKHNLCHAWPTFSFLPETRQTLNEMQTFFRKERIL
ncbi:MAG: alpha/beta hydrolase [Lachnospiraceae bacterium]|nr:alpha/beta hydrolase [Lachnospiraceae bacterium]